jgi:hypothetical protein
MSHLAPASRVWLGPRVVYSGFLIARRVGQGLDPWSWPPRMTMEAIREALVEALLIELR